ncbi:hypothetical protein ACFO4L_12120 [Bacillus daqingensis]|uniref:Uncharacterized protein n=1 Tax=Bacillus daqingensis TaxID=872396 RepID=A0ABV9NVC5_9BACI
MNKQTLFAFAGITAITAAVLIIFSETPVIDPIGEEVSISYSYPSFEGMEIVLAAVAEDESEILLQYAEQAGEADADEEAVPDHMTALEGPYEYEEPVLTIRQGPEPVWLRGTPTEYNEDHHGELFELDGHELYVSTEETLGLLQVITNYRDTSFLIQLEEIDVEMPRAELEELIQDIFSEIRASYNEQE